MAEKGERGRNLRNRRCFLLALCAESTAAGRIDKQHRKSSHTSSWALTWGRLWGAVTFSLCRVYHCRTTGTSLKVMRAAHECEWYSPANIFCGETFGLYLNLPYLRGSSLGVIGITGISGWCSEMPHRTVRRPYRKAGRRESGHLYLVRDFRDYVVGSDIVGLGLVGGSKTMGITS